MKILSVLLSLIVFVQVAQAQSNLVFDRDSVVKHRSCPDGPGISRVVVRNQSDETKTFDLLLIEGKASIWFDSASVPGTTPFNISNVELAAYDSMWFELQWANWEGVHSGTVVIQTKMATVDTLFLRITNQSVILSNTEFNHDFGHVEIGDSVSVEHKIENIGSIPFIVKRIEIDTHHWQIENIAIGDTINEGETRAIRIVYEPTSPQGPFSSFVRVVGVCGAVNMQVSVYVPSKGLHWMHYELRDTVTECRRGGTYTVKLHNSAEVDILMDSIVFDTASTGWSFITPQPKNVVVLPGQELEYTVERAVYSKNTKLNIVYSGGKRTWILFTITNNVALPVIKNSPDTVVFEIEEGEGVWFNALIENRGARGYQVQSIERVGSPLWEITTPDTAAIIGTETLMVQTHFSGAELPGEYAVTYTLRDVACDSTLSQTLIARVGTLGVNERESDPVVHVYPTVASREIEISADKEFNYTLIDLLGRIVLSGQCMTGNETLRVDHLPQGKYYVRVISAHGVETQSISIMR